MNIEFILCGIQGTIFSILSALTTVDKVNIFVLSFFLSFFFSYYPGANKSEMKKFLLLSGLHPCIKSFHIEGHLRKQQAPA